MPTRRIIDIKDGRKVEREKGGKIVVLVPDSKPTPAQITFTIARIILEVIYAPNEVWGRD